MGTRSYAEKVAQLVDPTGKYFGDRVLSRDESGSTYLLVLYDLVPIFFFQDVPIAIVLVSGITQKTIYRLFPCDDSMVVVIDDRADIWDHSPNVVRVIPC
jgi:RNA polymerase II subunit A-like phosphatase